MFMIMMIWRTQQMNDDTIIDSMIEFIESQEKQIQADKLRNDNKLKTDIVNSILNELRGKTTNDNT